MHICTYRAFFICEDAADDDSSYEVEEQGTWREKSEENLVQVLGFERRGLVLDSREVGVKES